MAKVRIQVKRHSWHRASLWIKYKRPAMTRAWPNAPRFTMSIRPITRGERTNRKLPRVQIWYEEFVTIDPETVEQWMNDIFREPK